MSIEAAIIAEALDLARCSIGCVAALPSEKAALAAPATAPPSPALSPAPASGVLGSGCLEYAAARMPAEPAAATCVVRMVRTRRCANQRETCSDVQPGIVEAYLFRTIRIRVTHRHRDTHTHTHTHSHTEKECVCDRETERQYKLAAGRRYISHDASSGSGSTWKIRSSLFWSSMPVVSSLGLSVPPSLGLSPPLSAAIAGLLGRPSAAPASNSCSSHLSKPPLKACCGSGSGSRRFLPCPLDFGGIVSAHTVPTLPRREGGAGLPGGR
jgi:hypothetical protein